MIVQLALAAVLMLGVAGQASGAEFDHVTLARQAIERHIRPGYQRLAVSAAGVEGVMRPYCARQTPAARKAVETAFDRLVVAWGRIEHIAFGPVASGDRIDRIMFWPDRRGIAARQLANALRSGDPGVTDPAVLAEKSAAVQGLPALESLLFSPPAGDETADGRRHRCAFAAAVAANLRRMTGEVAAAWGEAGDFSKIWLAPGPENPTYLKPSETTFALAKALDLGLEKVRDQRIGGPLGLNPQRRKLPPVFPRSGRTMLLISANIAGLRELYGAGGLEKAIAATATAAPAEDRVTLAHLVATELETAGKRASALVGVPKPFDTPAQMQRVIALGFPLKNARATAVALLASSAGLPLGFNASDGD